MAYTVGSAFNSFRINSVDLPASNTQKARSSRDYLFDQIRSLAQSYSDFPKLYGDYLSFGSFARKTKIRPLDDIDVLVLLSGRGTKLSHHQGYTYDIIIDDRTSPLYSFADSSNYYYNQYFVNSTRVLNRIRDRLGSIHNYKKADLKKTMQAVTLNLGSYDWVFDIVPALPVGDNGNTEYYLIPDGKGKWIRTNPNIDSANVSRVNSKHNGNFLPIIRLLKYWNKRTSKSRLPSYYFEYLTIKVFENSPTIVSTSQAIKYFFDNCPLYIQLPCPDPKQLGADLDSGIDWATKDKVRSAMSQASQLAGNAIWYETKSSSSEAINSWRTVFGTEFPIYG